MRLPADSPAEWVQRHFAAAFPDHGPESVRVLSIEELSDGGLRELLGEMTALGTPPAAAGMYLSGWFGGLASAFVGFGLVAADAGFELSAGTRWWVHPDGFADALELPALSAVVLPDHPWAGRPDTVVVADRDEQARVTIRSLVERLTPLVDALQDLTRAGRVGLWHEVGDALGSALVYQQAVPVTKDGLSLLRGLLAVPSAPWKRRPRIELLTAPGGPVCVTHKGGCCLAYTDQSEDDHVEDDDHRAFQEAFPEPPEAQAYCVNCKFRPYERSVEMQLWWRAREQATS